MLRSAATTWLTEEFNELATEINFTPQQLGDCYSTAIDMSLRQLGYTEDVLLTQDVPQTQIVGYLALLNYYALKRFARAFAIRFDTNIAGSLQAFRSQAANQIKALLDDAKVECTSLGFAVDTPQFQLGRMELDFLEPTLGDFS